ncbi:GTPase-activating protein skywalker-like isoform X2 [Physella acuta]|uniref:GTPase-activating protein skywalker-like isoform X2 n=1 Tax=Physella acuta TaxID=109671 RepID=UPI0027DC958F|nr:GTPase-activating protein skywalker-like isoform X2 [Physella acuta]
MLNPSNDNECFHSEPWPADPASTEQTNENVSEIVADIDLEIEGEKEQLLGCSNSEGSKRNSSSSADQSTESNVSASGRSLFNKLQNKSPLSHKEDKLKFSKSTTESAAEHEKHVSFKAEDKYAPIEDDEPEPFVFVAKKASKFGRGSSSTDFFGYLLDEDDTDSNNVLKSSPDSHKFSLSSSPNKDVQAVHEKDETKISYSPVKSEPGSRSFLKDKFASSLRSKPSSTPVKGSEKSPLLGKHSSPSSPVSSVNASLHRHSSKEDSQLEHLLSPTRSYNSSEDDSQFHNISEDTDQHPSPSVLSDEGEGVCSKYSQLSEHGSSTSSPVTSGENGDRRNKSDEDIVKKQNGLDGNKADASAGFLDNPLQLGIAFSEFVDVENFKRHLGTHAPKTEDKFGGRSEDHLLVLLRSGSHRNLKSYLRNSQWPAESDARRRLWENLCSHLFEKDKGNLYKEIAEEVCEEGVGDDMVLPTFLDQSHLQTYFLNIQGVRSVKIIMNVISRLSPDIIYCPMLYPMSSLFLHYMSPEACFTCMQVLLSANSKKQSLFFLTQTKVKTEASKYVLLDLAKKYTKHAYVLIERSSPKSPVAVLDNWMWWIFRDLPFQYLVCIIDSYLLEGYKVFYRVALAIIFLFTKDSNRRGSRNSPVLNLGAAIARFCTNMPYDSKKLIKVGFGIRGLTRKEITKLHTKHETNIKNLPVKDTMSRIVTSQSMAQLGLARPFKGQMTAQQSSSAVLTAEMLQTIWTWIPFRLTLMRPKLLFSSDEDGTALRTLYQKTEHAPQTVLAIKTTNNEVFGAYCSASWHTRHEKNKPHLSFFGTGETFVFTFQPCPIKFPWTGTLGDNAPAHPVDHFMAGDDTMLVVGSGNGEAIYLDTMMNRCSTTHCETFDNDPLCTEQDFSCQIVQVFGFDD